MRVIRSHRTKLKPFRYNTEIKRVETVYVYVYVQRTMLLTGRLVTVTIFVFFMTFIITYHITTYVAKNQTLQTIADMRNGLLRLTSERDDLMKNMKKDSSKWQKAKDDREELSKRLNVIVRDYNLLLCSMINEVCAKRHYKFYISKEFASVNRFSFIFMRFVCFRQQIQELGVNGHWQINISQMKV